MEPTKTTTKKKDSVPKIHAIERPKLSYQTSFTRLRFSKLEYEFFVATNVNVKLYTYCTNTFVADSIIMTKIQYILTDFIFNTPLISGSSKSAEIGKNSINFNILYFR